ncbi:hypothetical protein AMTR_s00030p00229810 [Amborella trichopoda]|uniref:Uncharacterized protein n=1 Tax=Amborella trichopoda TaxID=13333 RepID=U5D1R0_AMBTC|nr:hypothetical protein AMTR_s00030p00229810 [Amborella trichopoda]
MVVSQPALCSRRYAHGDAPCSLVPLRSRCRAHTVTLFSAVVRALSSRAHFRLSLTSVALTSGKAPPLQDDIPFSTPAPRFPVCPLTPGLDSGLNPVLTPTPTPPVALDEVNPLSLPLTPFPSSPPFPVVNQVDPEPLATGSRDTDYADPYGLTSTIFWPTPADGLHPLGRTNMGVSDPSNQLSKEGKKGQE